MIGRISGERLENILSQSSFSRLDFKALCEQILVVYCYGFTMISFIHLFLTYFYAIFMEKSCDNNGRSFRNNDTTSYARNIEYFMSFFGQIHRKDIHSGAFYYNIFFISSIYLYTMRKLSKGKILKDFSDSRFISFLNGTSEVQEQVSEEIDLCLKRLIQSSSVYNREFIGNSSLKLPLKLIKMSAFSNHVGKPSILSFRATNFRAESFDVNQIKRSIGGDNYSDDTLTKSVAQQIQYLAKLTINKESIWPRNRTNIWASQMRRITKLSYNFNSIAGWLIGQFSCQYMIYDAHNHFKQHQLHTEGDQVEKFNLIDRTMMIMYVLYNYFAISWFVAYLIIPFMSTADQIRAIYSFESRLTKLKYKMNELYEIQQTSYNGSLGLVLKSIRDKLKIECDREAIEFYINYHIFFHDVRKSINLAQVYLNRNITVGLLILLPPAVLYKLQSNRCDLLTSNQTIPIIILLSIVLMLSVNLFIWIGAFLNESCIRLYKCIWPIIAMEVHYNHYAFDRRYGRSLSLDQDELPEASSYEYYSFGAITPHTIMLYRRLVENEDCIMENFVGNVYGLFKVDYGGLLKFNFYIISCLLLLAR